MKGEINKIDISNNKKKKVINTKTMEIFNSSKLIKTNNVQEAKDFVKIVSCLLTFRADVFTWGFFNVILTIDNPEHNKESNVIRN